MSEIFSLVSVLFCLRDLCFLPKKKKREKRVFVVKKILLFEICFVFMLVLNPDDAKKSRNTQSKP